MLVSSRVAMVALWVAVLVSHAPAWPMERLFRSLGPMRILAAIHPPTTTRAILKSLGLPIRAPPIAPVQPVPQDWSLTEPSASRYRANRIDRPAA